MRILLAFLAVFLLSFSPLRAEEWPAASMELLQKAKEHAPEGDALKPLYLPTSDGRSFVLIWTPTTTPPKQWIVSMPGTAGYATRDLAVWYPSLKGRDVGLIVMQWWMGTGDSTKDYYTPFETYREIDKILARLKVEPDTALLHGFSRGSANIYAVAALDRAKGHRYFSTFVANAGGAMLGYPPTKLVSEGEFGAKPYAGTKWVTSCGDKDEHPERDGCPAMRRTADWLEGLGAMIAMRIEDPDKGHGALHLNPDNAKRLLDSFTK